jgi:hypothetical protein
MIKLFKELEVVGPVEEINSLEQALIAGKFPDWRHDQKTQSATGKLDSKPNERSLVFQYTGEVLPPARLFLFIKQNSMKTTNIVPVSSGRLTVEQYNDIQDSFVQLCLRPTIASDSVEIIVSSAEREISEWLSPTANQYLKAFASNANKGTGASHPMDNRRWLKFLIQAHRDSVSLDSSTLLKWLTEEMNWPSDTAWDLSIQYEQSRELLAVYDGTQ